MNRVLLCFVVLAAISCGRSEAPARSEAPIAPIAPMAPMAPTAPRVVVLGDSLTAGLGIPREQSYPSVLQRKLQEEGSPLEVVNAGVSGDTTADGLRRVTWALEGDVRLMILALGANDGLRGLPATQMKANLQSIIDRARQRAIPVLLVGMEAPPNYGEQYAASFRQVFRDLARENKLTFVPFLLEGVAGVPNLNQPDGVHPTSAGATRIATHLWPTVKTMIDK
ncbi:MAG TPA: arylesterase [Vicinamibacterales bacterium]|nr:arylesterase [Vicinamibacterales bacterium]